MNGRKRKEGGGRTEEERKGGRKDGRKEGGKKEKGRKEQKMEIIATFSKLLEAPV